MPAYDSVHFDPPAPMAYVTLRNPDIGATLPDIAMLLDTGSDITLVPRSAIQPLGASIVQDTLYELSGFDGSKSFAPVVRLELLFCGGHSVDNFW